MLIGEREQYRQLQEKFDDEFMLGDLTMEFDLGRVLLTSISSYTERDLLVTRDATQLTGSVTFDIILGGDVERGPAEFDAVRTTPTVEVFTQELRLASDYDGRLPVGARRLLQRHRARTTARPCRRPAMTPAEARPAHGSPRRRRAGGHAVLLAHPVRLRAARGLCRGHVRHHRAVEPRRSARRYYDFEEDRDPVLRRRIRGLRRPADRATTARLDGSTTASCRACCSSYDVTDNVQLNAQASEGFRLGGINDPLNIPLCSPEDIVTFGGRPMFDERDAAGTTSSARRSASPTAAASSTFPPSTRRSTTCRSVMLAGTCSSRIVINVPEAHSTGVGVGAHRAADRPLRFRHHRELHRVGARSSVDRVVDGVPTIIAGIEDGNRLPVGAGVPAVGERDL